MVGRGRKVKMVYGKPRPVQIIPSVLPADWANMGAECKRLEVENRSVDSRGR